MTPSIPRTAWVIGAGAWGTALANVLARNSLLVTLWCHDPEVAATITEQRENTQFLPQCPLHDGITATHELPGDSTPAIVILAVPSLYLLETVVRLSLSLDVPLDVPILIATKGLYSANGHSQLLSEALQAEMPDHTLAILSGPNLAHEIGRGLPAISTIACTSLSMAHHSAALLGNHFFRPYVSDDVIGVQLAGAVKNVLAIGAGIVRGRELGENAVAGFITRGLAELARISAAMGGKAETLLSPAAIGDIILTCGSLSSRNSSLGIALGKGQRLDAILAERRGVTEGVETSRAIHQLVAAHHIEAPLCEAIYRVLHEKADISEAIHQLLTRPLV